MFIIGKTDIGKVRSENQDGFIHGAFDDGASWAVVCDGMGGPGGGQLASSTVINLVGEKIRLCYNESMKLQSFENLFLSAITTANVALYDKGCLDTSLHGMGTTIVAVIVKDGQACIAHVGDSRVYKISDGKLTQITRDHSLAQEMLDGGQITPEEYASYPKNIITRAVGISENVDIEFNFTDIADGDALILCSDGFSGLVSHDDILDIYSSTDFDELAGKYIDKANENGGFDNITVVVMKG